MGWKGYSLHTDKLTDEEKAAREEIRKIKWRPLYWLLGGFFLFLLAAVFNKASL
jgi:hypothetical protein